MYVSIEGIKKLVSLTLWNVRMPNECFRFRSAKTTAQRSNLAAGKIVRLLHECETSSGKPFSDKTAFLPQLKDSTFFEKVRNKIVYHFAYSDLV